MGVAAAHMGLPRIPLEPVDAVMITTLVENVYDIFMPDQGPVVRWGPIQTKGRTDASIMLDRSVPEQLVAEHGFSVMVDVSRAGRTHRILFDLGVSPTGMVENMRRLDIDPKDIEAVVCSHGHYDHTAGLEGLAGRLGRANLPVIIHPEFWNRRRLVFPGRDPLELPTTSRRALEGVGFTIIEEGQPSFLLDGSVLITGEVPRVTDYEPGFPFQQAWRSDHWEPDPLVLDDQAMVINVRDQGLVVITGCGHAGVVNITRYARLLTRESRVAAIVGGFHLNGPVFEPLIDRVCADLLEMQPAWIVPGHCTGWRAHHAMSRVFKDSFVPSCVGTRLRLGTAAA
jgi:7,8-dihydropterin-6-yl-methyl-4-(beta-D-ribofuranosyl)aminobenzene 5'-phosphate synthase